MATKKTDKKGGASAAKKAPAKKAAEPKKAKGAKAAKGEKKAPANVGPRHPRGRVQAGAGSKEALAKAIAPTLARSDEDADTVATRLKTASNSQLLRLQRVAEAVKQKYGSRDGLIEAIGKSANKTKDKDYLAKLGKLPLPHLLDLAKTAERRARA